MNITEVLEAFAYLVVSVLCVFVVPAVKNKIGAQEMDNFLKWVDIAVAAAEQLYASTQGEVKKRYVLNYLTSKGFVVEEDELNLAIEAAVNRLHSELYGDQYADS
jgi:hypothetical protein